MTEAIDNTILVGELGGQGGISTLAGRGISFHYGYPAYGLVEPNVAAQWIFDEASGSIVDEVSGITLGVTGAPSYNLIATGLYAGLSPSIGITGQGMYFNKGSAEATMNAGTGSITLEVWFSDTQFYNGMGVFSTQAAAGATGYTLYIDGGAQRFQLAMVATDATSVTVAYNFSRYWLDGQIHKLRAVWNRTTNLVLLYCDGILQGGTGDLSPLAGKTVNAGDVKIGTPPDLSWEFEAQYYEVRVSLNATNNSGGPAGG